VTRSLGIDQSAGELHFVVPSVIERGVAAADKTLSDDFSATTACLETQTPKNQPTNLLAWPAQLACVASAKLGRRALAGNSRSR